MSSRCIYVVACIQISLLLEADKYSIVQMDHILLIWSSTDGLWGCFQLFSLVSNHVLHVGIQLSIDALLLILLGYIFTFFFVMFIHF